MLVAVCRNVEQRRNDVWIGVARNVVVELPVVSFRSRRVAVAEARSKVCKNKRIGAGLEENPSEVARRKDENAQCRPKLPEPAYHLRLRFNLSDPFQKLPPLFPEKM